MWKRVVWSFDWRRLSNVDLEFAVHLASQIGKNFEIALPASIVAGNESLNATDAGFWHRPVGIARVYSQPTYANNALSLFYAALDNRSSIHVFNVQTSVMRDTSKAELSRINCEHSAIANIIQLGWASRLTD